MDQTRNQRRRSKRLALAAAVLCLLVPTSPAAAQELPACEPGEPASDCRLPAWPEDVLQGIPSPFGSVEGTVWLEDALGDAPAGGLDILALGISSVDVTDPGAIRDLDGLLKLGKAKKAVRPGQNVLVRVVLDRPLVDTTDGHATVHVTTDRDRSRSNNAPAGVGQGLQPFAGVEDVATVAYATTTGETTLLDSDLAGGWYEDKDPFAAVWAAPAVLDLLLRPEALGDSLAVVTYTSGTDGGYDLLSLGTGPVPLDGVVGLRPACLGASLSGESFVIARLSEGGQTLRDVEAATSWRGEAGFRPDQASLDALRSYLASADDDGDGRVALPVSVNLFEDGTVIGQRADLWLALDGDQLELVLEIGVTRRGYEVLRAVDVDPTGDAVVDAWLVRALEAFVEAVPPFRSARQAGTLVGEGSGSCATALAGARASSADADSPVEPTPEPS